jgi:hypothetical protein
MAGAWRLIRPCRGASAALRRGCLFDLDSIGQTATELEDRNRLCLTIRSSRTIHFLRDRWDGGRHAERACHDSYGEDSLARPYELGDPGRITAVSRAKHGRYHCHDIALMPQP